MMTAGLLMMALAAFFLVALRGNIERAPWLKWVPWVIILPYIGNSFGWILTEMGRQPWIVQGLLTVSEGISPNLTSIDLLISLLGYLVLYSSLGAANVYLMRKYAIAGPDAAMKESVEVAPVAIGSQD
jgi:cytochrome d ubiquinol oxidase subunit I